jgi:hypothetical protein
MGGYGPGMLPFSQVRYFLARAIYPEGFFNEDASREIDRLTVENDRLRELLKGCKQ